MMRALYTAATGMIAQQSNVDNISNNLANVNTVGYKEQKTEFKSLLYQTIQTRTTSANGEEKPISAQVGLGTRVASNTSVFTQGAPMATENTTDFMINGEGFFAVRGADGETYYTRAGNFTWAVNGNEITLPAGVSSGQVVVSDDGAFGYYTANGQFVDMNRRFAIYQFNNPAGLEKEGSNLLSETPASGAPLNEATNNNVVRSKIMQGYLEGSNVQVADEMVNMIIAQRAYQLNSKAINAADEMLEQANNLRR